MQDASATWRWRSSDTHLAVETNGACKASLRPAVTNQRTYRIYERTWWKNSRRGQKLLDEINFCIKHDTRSISVLKKGSFILAQEINFNTPSGLTPPWMTVLRTNIAKLRLIMTTHPQLDVDKTPARRGAGGQAIRISHLRQTGRARHRCVQR